MYKTNSCQTQSVFIKIIFVFLSILSVILSSHKKGSDNKINKLHLFMNGALRNIEFIGSVLFFCGTP